MSLDLNDDKSTLVPSGNKPLITWANFDSDLCRHMASLGHNELNGLPWHLLFSAETSKTKLSMIRLDANDYENLHCPLLTW